MLVPGNAGDRIAFDEPADDGAEAFVLGRLEGLAFEAFELDADRVVVAIAPAVPIGSAGMPGSVVAGDELQQGPAAAQQKVGGHAQAANRPEIGMGGPVEPVGEEPLDRVAAVLTGWQADRVNDDEVDPRRRRPRVEIRRLERHRLAQPAVAPGRRGRRAGPGAHSRSAAPESPPTLTLRRAIR